jgi:hypothetical protein
MLECRVEPRLKPLLQGAGVVRADLSVIPLEAMRSRLGRLPSIRLNRSSKASITLFTASCDWLAINIFPAPVSFTGQ